VKPGMRPGMRSLLGLCIRELPYTTPRKLPNKTLEHLDSWDFNVYETCGDKPVIVFTELGVELFRRHGLLERYTISYEKLRAYLRHIGMKYSAAVPYHTVVKATAALQAMHFFLTSGLERLIDPLHTIALLFACCVHCVDHPGVNNAFVQQMGTGGLHSSGPGDFALEKHHLSIGFAALEMPQLDFLRTMDKPTLREFKRLVTEFVVATDITQHGVVLSQWASLRSSEQDSPMLRQDVLCKIAVKCADFSGFAARPHIMRMTATRLFEEFHSQGDRERAANLPLTPLCDRDSFDLTVAVDHLLCLIVRPTFEAFNEGLQNSVIQNTCITQLDYNIAHLEKVLDDGVDET